MLNFGYLLKDSQSSTLTISWKVPLCMLSCFSLVCLSVTPWSVACQAPLSMGFSKQEYWSGFPCLLPGDRPNPGTEPASLMSHASTGRCFTSSATLVTWPIFSCMLSTFSVKFLILLIIVFFQILGFDHFNIQCHIWLWFDASLPLQTVVFAF